MKYSEGPCRIQQSTDDFGKE
jgi:excisionase family DNA binding protein